ncbi:unnamed protein product, partial [Meganyctiphanes norvegica]
ENKIMAPTFGELQMDLMSALASSDMLKDLESHINHDQSEDSMFNWIWGLPEAHANLVPVPKAATKRGDAAEELRKVGWDWFRKGNIRKALELLNKCLMMAPHPKCSISNSDATHEPDSDNTKSQNENEFKTLVEVYANRSEVLFHLKQYEKCILDINRVLTYADPNSIDEAIIERKVKCLIILGHHAEAKSISPKPFEILNNNDINLDFIEKINDHIKDSSTISVDHMFSYQSPDPPKLIECNPSIPNFSHALDLKFSPEKGRYAVATKDIKPGEVVLVEASHVSCPNSDMENLQTHCCYCLKRCHAPVPCLNCDKVVFCNENCRSIALDKFHNDECEILPTLISLNMDKKSIQTLRLILQSTFLKLRNSVSRLKHEKLTKTEQKHGFNSDGIYNSNDYRTVYHLEGNTKHISTADLFQNCGMAFLLTKLLINDKDFFVDENNQKFEPEIQDITFLGSTILHHLSTFPFNVFAITEVNKNIHKPKMNHIKNIGSGIYPSASLLNHSCDASTVRCNFGNVLVMYAKKFIQAGEEVSDNYGYSYQIVPKETRIPELRINYKFECSCEACDNNWETMRKVSETKTTKIKYGAKSNSEDKSDHTNNNLEGELLKYKRILHEINSSEASESDR